MSPRFKRLLKALYIGLCLGLFISTVLGYRSISEGATERRFNNGEPIGGDYIAFYTGGALLREEDSLTTLYSFENQLSFQQEFYGEEYDPSQFLPFAYPPLVGLFFIPLSGIPFLLSYQSWVLLSFLFALVSIELLIRAHPQRLKGNRTLIYASFAAFTPFTIDALAGGQLTPFGLFVIAFAYLLFQKQSYFLMGLVLSLGYYKAPLFAFLMLALFLTQPKHFRLGLLSGLTVLIGLELLLFGLDGYLFYITTVIQYLTGKISILHFIAPATLGVGIIRPLKEATSFAPILLGALGLCFLNPLTKFFKSHPQLAFALSVVATIAFSFQVNNYDFALLFVPALLVFVVFQDLSGLGKKLAITMAILLTLECAGVTPEPLLLPLLTLISLCLIFAERTLRENTTAS